MTRSTDGKGRRSRAADACRGLDASSVPAVPGETRRAEPIGRDAGVYATWRWTAVAQVVSIARRCGLAIREVYEAPTGSLYVRLKRLGSRGVRVRISDHRSRRLGPREFSIRHDAPGRLEELEAWLRRTASLG